MNGPQDDLTPRVLARLAAQPAAPLAGAPGEAPAAQLAAILAQARAAAAALNAELAGGSLADRNHYDYLAQNLVRLAQFQSFSLAEYTLHLADGRNPGLRLGLEERQWRRRVEVLLFPEVGRWRVDAAGRKITRPLLTLWLENGGLRPVPGEGLEPAYRPDEDWPPALARAFCLAATLKF